MPPPQAKANSQRRTIPFPAGGGIDLSTPAIMRDAGTLLDAQNFYSRPQGGGYERFRGLRYMGRPGASVWRDSPLTITGDFHHRGTNYRRVHRLFHHHGQLYMARLVHLRLDNSTLIPQGIFTSIDIQRHISNTRWQGTYWQASGDYHTLDSALQGIITKTTDGNVGLPVPNFRVMKSNFRGNEEGERIFFVFEGAYPYAFRRFVGDHSLGDYRILSQMERIDVFGEHNVPSDLDRFTRCYNMVGRHADRLVLGSRSGSLIISSAGDELDFTSQVGTQAAFAIGESITALFGDYQGGMIICTRNKTGFLSGRTLADFNYRVLSPTSGAFPDSAQVPQNPMVLDDRGFRILVPTERFGDLALQVASEPIRPIVQKKLAMGVVPTASLVVRDLNQYRCYMSDGSCFVGVFVQGQRGNTIEWSMLQFDFVVDDAVSVQGKNGNEQIYIVTRSGVVYRSDVERQGGVHDDPAHRSVDSFMMFSDSSMNLPTYNKKVYRVQCDVETNVRENQEAVYHIAYNIDRGQRWVYDGCLDVTGRAIVPKTVSINGAQTLAGVPHSLWSSTGTGFNCRTFSLWIGANKQDVYPFTITGYTVDMAPRKMVRGGK